MPTAEEPPDTPAFPTGFRFGSYGRVVVASDLDGGTGNDADIVSQGPRIDEGTYVELELRRQDEFADALRTRIVATLAIAGPLFHFDGEFDEKLAVRNLFLEVDNALTEGLALWAGSRMVRGDDIYLLDHWPLDNLNMIGGGARYAIGQYAEVSAQVGLARPDDPFQRQVIEVADPAELSTEEVVILDRPRWTVSGKVTGWPLGRFEDTGIKGVLYAESHHLPSGEREREGSGEIEQLPSDSGWVLGGQVGGWMSEHNAFVNLFVRYARGLGAYDPLGVPFSKGATFDTDRAREVRLGLSANVEWRMLGLMLGGWYRWFRDADPALFERNELVEGVVAARPHVWIGDHVGIAAEASYQALETTALDPETGQGVGGSAVKLGLIPFFSPGGRGTYTRPHLRVIYAATLRDEGAQRLYPDRDPRSQQSVEHFLGIGAEWWFDSTSYQ